MTGDRKVAAAELEGADSAREALQVTAAGGTRQLQLEGAGTGEVQMKRLGYRAPFFN